MLLLSEPKWQIFADAVCKVFRSSRDTKRDIRLVEVSTEPPDSARQESCHRANM
jgi:hypothetical protein